MNRTILSWCALGLAGASHAQSSVTLFGVVDMAVSGYANETRNAFGATVTTSQTALTSSGYTQGRLGFRGTEDLGGGLAASFWLEGALVGDTGNGAASGGGFNFNRRSTVSLSGPFGELRLGRDYTPTFWNDNVFDPFNNNGVGASLLSAANGYSSNGAATNGFTANTAYVRTSNSVGYFLPPSLGGFYGQATFALNEQTRYDPGFMTPPGAAAIAANPSLAATGNNARAGRYWGLRGGYANGPLDIAIAYGESTIASNFYLGTTSVLNIWNVGASYDLGVLKVVGEYSNNALDVQRAIPIPNAGNSGANGLLLGASVPVGPGLVRAAYSNVQYRNVARPAPTGQPEADKWSLGYVYNLSKRTALYASVARLNDKNGADLLVGGPNFYQATGPGQFTPKRSSGYDIGLRHVF